MVDMMTESEQSERIAVVEQNRSYLLLRRWWLTWLVLRGQYLPEGCDWVGWGVIKWAGVWFCEVG